MLPVRGAAGKGDAYKWVALSNTTLAMVMATIDGSIVIVALPAIFRGINLNPLTPGNVTYLLWMIMGYLLVQSILVVTLGRLGDIFGRVKIYNLGFVVFTLASIGLSFDPFQGTHGALWLIGWRFVQAFGGVDAHGQLRGDPHRRVPRGQARHGARHQPGRRHLRPVRRPAARRPAVRLGLAGGLLDQPAVRRVRHHLGLQVAQGDREHAQGAHRLARQPHLRGRRRACCSSRSPSASARTATTRPAGATRWCSAP